MNTTGNIPSPSAPFLGEDGRISQIWWQFMVSMFSRTGSAKGFDATALVLQIATLQAQNTALTTQVATLTAQTTALTTQAATLTTQNTALTTQNATLQTQVNAIPLPAGYSKALSAGVVRKIPYYS